MSQNHDASGSLRRLTASAWQRSLRGLARNTWADILRPSARPVNAYAASRTTAVRNVFRNRNGRPRMQLAIQSSGNGPAANLQAVGSIGAGARYHRSIGCSSSKPRLAYKRTALVGRIQFHAIDGAGTRQFQRGRYQAAGISTALVISMSQHHADPCQILAISEQRRSRDYTTILLDARNTRAVPERSSAPNPQASDSIRPPRRVRRRRQRRLESTSHRAESGLSRSHAVPCFQADAEGCS